MAEYDTRALYALAGGLLLGAAAYTFKWMPGSSPLLFAAAPSGALCGYFILQSWRNGSGREKLEPLLHYTSLLAFAWILLGWLFVRSAWLSQEATLLTLAFLLPAASDWLLERTTLKSFVPEPEAEIMSGEG